MLVPEQSASNKRIEQAPFATLIPMRRSAAHAHHVSETHLYPAPDSAGEHAKDGVLAALDSAVRDVDQRGFGSASLSLAPRAASRSSFAP